MKSKRLEKIEKDVELLKSGLRCCDEEMFELKEKLEIKEKQIVFLLGIDKLDACMVGTVFRIFIDKQSKMLKELAEEVGICTECFSSGKEDYNKALAKAIREKIKENWGHHG